MEKDTVEEILNYLDKNQNLSEPEFINAIKAIGLTGDKKAIPFLIDQFKNFDSLSWKIRNVIAISLGDLGADEAVPFLMKILKDKKYKGYSGSFLYALTIKPLECKDYFLDFIELLCSDSLEIRESADELIAMHYKNVDTQKNWRL